VDRLAIAGAVAALEDRSHFETTRRAVMLSREALAKSLKALGFEVLPSSANFLFARHHRHDARHLASALQERSIFVRHIPYPRIEQYLRITVGTDSDCTALLSALRELTCS
jgi:histidinol-phosphate aminotransferase